MIEFGCVLPQESADYDSVKQIALECERLGFNSIWLYDHFFPFWKSPDGPILECWTTLSALAADTRTLRLGTIVLSNTFRNPAMLAKMAATLDVISRGRLEFGIGAGVCENEHHAYGIPFEKPSVRIERLREAVHIIRAMWANGRCSYEGRYYVVKDAFNNPAPVQKPNPRIWIGGMGDRVLRVVAELADGCNFWGLNPAEFRRRSSTLENHCKALGREPTGLQRSWGGEILINDNKKEIDRMIERFKPRELTIDQYVGPNIVGAPDECLEKINRYREAGSTYFMLYFPDALEGESLRLFAEHVISKIDD